MLIRRIARPMLATTFITRGVEALRSPKPAADAARPTLEGLSKLPDPVGPNVPTNAETVAKVTAGVQIGAGLLLAAGKLPRSRSAALAVSVVPGSLGGHAFWNETDPDPQGRRAQGAVRRRRPDRRPDHRVGRHRGQAVAGLAGPSRRAQGRASAVSGVLPSGRIGDALIDSELVDRVGRGTCSPGCTSAPSVAASSPTSPASAAPSWPTWRASAAPNWPTSRPSAVEFADVARDRAPKLAKKARKRGSELAELPQDRSAELAGRRAEARRRAGRHRPRPGTRDRQCRAGAWGRTRRAARDRGYELAELAQDRGSEIATASRKQAKRTRKEVDKEIKRAHKEAQKRAG